ncbi:bifunctional phosphopantothenoylcysteine decarboxylase/phosphopantothenate--cysteine ligase CoaBC [Microbacterium album]|uniref:Coenzyme A biosynthesis bifunctional protein CoaBC n=1 Tax=Microbacterium album TaxID=2053191 RepID=A0A917MM76_9MICO|nr:bifunctional phosphopantothenoylcysteine decarboxylase/phosphopantothenate--cysteine ligase CoaBC [Microbacterium album]GGH45429.1 coenzyme A biosynthesis bifunctional protein CoaBC [Microbacterium album]
MNIVVGVTGGIAAYKTVHLVRLLVKDGHEVHVVPTEDALRFVGAPTWEAISRHPVTTSVHDDVAQVRHVALGQAADLVVVAPATANTLAKMAAGLAGDLLGTTLLATRAPVLVAPAMHMEMWLHPATQANVTTLAERGVRIIGPDSGQLTGADSGPGRMSEPEAIHAEIARLLAAGRDLAGLRIAVSAGGTREPIDPVRFIGNRSSGRQGIAVALAAAERGADVTLVAAHIDGAVLADVRGRARIRLEHAGTASELGERMTALAQESDVVIMTAAVADYRVARVSDHKLTKDDGAPRIELVENADILAGLAAGRRSGQTIVGFAAEMPTDDESVIERGIRKRRRKGADLLAVNEVGWQAGFERADNTVSIIGPDDAVVATVSGSKREVADALLDAVLAARAS